MGLFDFINEHLSDAPEWKGKRFEDFIKKKFDEKQFTIVEQTHSHQTNQDRFVESSMNPDYVFRHNRTRVEFAVECKYRSSLYPKGMLNWSNPTQLKRYRDFAAKKKIPVYIVIGLGGVDKDPEDLFRIPLEDAKFPALYPSQFKPFSRNPKTDFYWKDGQLY
jgi:hypothetical protein